MSTSALKKTRKHYIYGMLFCIIFALIYEIFSHSVISYAMVLSFLWPMLGGVLLYTLLMKAPPRLHPTVAAALLYNSGIVLFTLGSVFQGVLEIYGTTNRLQKIYVIAGAFFLMSGILSYVLQTLFCREDA